MSAEVRDVLPACPCGFVFGAVFVFDVELHMFSGTCRPRKSRVSCSPRTCRSSNEAGHNTPDLRKVSSDS